MEQNNLITKAGNKTWLYLPNTSILSRYFKQKDLIELSKICKNYRNQLKSKALRTLTITENEYRLQILLNHNSENKFGVIINCLKRDLKGSSHLVKEVILELDFSNQLTDELFSLFPKVSNITIKCNKIYSLNNLIEILSNFNYLQNIILKSKSVNFDSLTDIVNYSFFYRLKSIMLNFPPHLVDQNLPFDVVDSSFSNLQSLTIINNRMLTKLSNGFPSLRFVELLSEYIFEFSQISLFISNNPQLKKLSISTGHLDEAVINSVLALERLYKLEIVDSLMFPAHGFGNLTENHSIEHLKYIGNGCNNHIVRIINMCKSLRIFETFGLRIGNLLESIKDEDFSEVDTLLLLNSFNISDSVTLLLESTKFKHVKFRDGCEFNPLYNKYKNLQKFNWVPKCDYSRDAVEFTLIRKSN